MSRNLSPVVWIIVSLFLYYTLICPFLGQARLSYENPRRRGALFIVTSENRFVLPRATGTSYYSMVLEQCGQPPKKNRTN